MRSLSSIVLAVCLTLSRVATAATADEAYEVAKKAYLDLKKDRSKSKLRHQWQRAARRFEAVVARFPKSERAPDAVFMCAKTHDELSHLSGRQSDGAEAAHFYRRLVERWPKHRLADDSAIAWVRLVRGRRGDMSQARAVLEAVRGGDLNHEVIRLLATLPPDGPQPSGSAPPVEAVSEASPPAESVAVQARRQPPQRDVPPSPPQQEAAPETVEGAQTHPLAMIQEALRDVRVGDRPHEGEASKDVSRFSRLARRERSAEMTLAQQLGLKVRRVVLDAGHGGRDTGAIGPGGTFEKDVALAVVKKLQAKLVAMGLEVVLTREDDSFVALEARSEFANQARGDLFISIHCNSATNTKLRGIETYTLNTSSNRYAMRLAARENATSQKGVGDLQYILADLATKANTSESLRLAERVQRTLVQSLSEPYSGVKDLGTKEALFFVLLGAKMPAILVETSFLSNATDEKRLNDEGYQHAIADSIAQGVGGFLDERSQLARVD